MAKEPIAYPHLVSRLRISGALHPVFRMPLGVNKDDLRLALLRNTYQGSVGLNLADWWQCLALQESSGEQPGPAPLHAIIDLPLLHRIPPLAE
jgi:hypothetical protein